MGHHRTHVVLVLEHCRVHFRLMICGLLRTYWGFSFGTLWSLVQADGI